MTKWDRTNVRRGRQASSTSKLAEAARHRTNSCIVTWRAVQENSLPATLAENVRPLTMAAPPGIGIGTNKVLAVLPVARAGRNGMTGLSTTLPHCYSSPGLSEHAACPCLSVYFAGLFSSCGLVYCKEKVNRKQAHSRPAVSGRGHEARTS